MLGADRAGEPGPFGTYTPDPGTGGHAALCPDQGGTPGEFADDECAPLRGSEDVPPRTGRT